MIFKDIKRGYPVYILKKEEGNMSVIQGKTVNDASQPYFPSMTPNMGAMNTMNAGQRFVDVTIEMDGRTNTYSIPETMSVTYAGNLVISTEREGILREVEAMKTQSDEVIKSVPKYEKISKDCERILEEWNPAFAEKKEQEKRINGLERKVEDIGKMLSEFITEFKK